MTYFVAFMAGWMLIDGILRCISLYTGHWQYRNKFGYCLDTAASFVFFTWALILWTNK